MGARKGNRHPGCQGTAPALEASWVRFRGMTQKQLLFRVIQNGFWAPRSSWRPPHLHCRFYASATFMPRGPTWQHSIGASSILSSDPWGCALVRLAFPACLAPSPLPFASFCPLMLLRAGPGRAPEPPSVMPPALRSSKCAQVTALLPCLYRHPWRGGSEGATAIPDVPAGVLSPTSGARALKEGLPTDKRLMEIQMTAGPYSRR